MARMSKYDKNRLTHRMLLYKDWDWIDRFARQKGGRQHHGRILRVWRWERPLYKHYKDWKAEAMDKIEWDQKCEKFILSNKDNR